MTDSTSSLKGTLQSDLHDSMRAKDKVRSGTLRMALTAVTNAEVAGKEHVDLTDDDVLKVIAKEAKKRKESAAAYHDANRPELASVEEAELEILEAYLPAQLDDAALEEMAKAAVAETGATGMAQMGAVMKVVQPQVAGRADGGRVAAAVRKALQA
ncbi:GatB/YqeY domain-containing protein [Ornithinimicrobium sp. Arc0846-15]|nr:GatB/YqeY domain-containing protein [Ornithinimicrobium laminariae]